MDKHVYFVFRSNNEHYGSGSSRYSTLSNTQKYKYVCISTATVMRHESNKKNKN